MIQGIINNEYTQSNGLQVVLQQLSEANEAEIVEQIYALSDRPEVLGLLIYKLMSERKRTNDLLEDMNKKYEKMQTLLELGRGIPNTFSNPNCVGKQIEDVENLFLTGQDKIILKMAQEKMITAKDVQEGCNYKGLNAASQRLKKLNREGYLDKQRVGQQVVFVLNKNFV